MIFFKISRDTKNRAEIWDCPGKNGTSGHPTITDLGEPGTYNSDFERLVNIVAAAFRDVTVGE